MTINKVIATFLMALGIFLIVKWTPLPNWIPFSLLFAGSIFGLVLIYREKGAKKLLVPVISWGIGIVSFTLLYIDEYFGWSEGWDAFRWLTPIFVSVLVATTSTVVLMFKSTK